MAPSHRFGAFVVLGGLKIAVAIVNIYNIVSFTNGGGEWDTLDPILNSPLWWNAPVYILCILLLVIFGLNELCVISPGNVIVTAGSKGSGKSAFMLNIAAANQNDFEVVYLNSEMHETEFKKRLKSMAH